MADMSKETIAAIVAEVSKELGERFVESQKKAVETESNAVLKAAQNAEKAASEKALADKVGQTGLADFVRSVVQSRGDLKQASKIAKEQYGNEVVSKALAESTFGDGGALVPPSFANEIVEVLRARTVVRALGASTVTLNNGTYTLPYGATGSNAFWIGENQNLTNTQQTFGHIQLVAKKLAAIIPMSNDLLRDTNANATSWIINDLGVAAGVAEDAAFLRGAGTQFSPKGMRSWSTNVVNSKCASGTSSTVDEIINDLATCLQTLQTNNIPMIRRAWAMAPRTFAKLMLLKDSVGNFYFKDEMSQGRLLGFPVAQTASIPTNLNVVTGRNSAESEVYFAEMSATTIGDAMDMNIELFRGAAYFDGTQVQSGISLDQSLVQLLKRTDFACRYRGAEVVLLQGVCWF